MAGLVSLPLIAQAAIARSGWRAGWLAVGIAVLVIGFVPTWLFMVRRPEDVGLAPDRATAPHASADRAGARAKLHPRQALRTPRSGCCACSRCSPIRCRPASACTRRRT